MDDTQKRPHVAGIDVQEVYFTLAANVEGATFAATIKVLPDYFVPEVNLTFETVFWMEIKGNHPYFARFGAPFSLRTDNGP